MPSFFSRSSLNHYPRPHCCFLYQLLYRCHTAPLMLLPPTVVHNPPLPTTASPPMSLPHSLSSRLDACPIRDWRCCHLPLLLPTATMITLICPTLPSTSTASSHDHDHSYLPIAAIYLCNFQPRYDHPHLPCIAIYLRYFQPRRLITLICRLQLT
ncbi:hypothetical protein B296_00008995 [Ensete ventricosum]|uniref:Uncharacterized protein n=1 Tax=Ensete ventricosum TaxID=4639 RepID=A0A426YHF1_ENSVE|nr:hypothetical protein B296_00008995 [Ensete ventricosum]